MSASRFRPRYHLSPRQNWMNDPNGLIWLDGQWHAFFQHNPWGPDWGHMSWGSAVSADLQSWRELPPALLATDSEAVFSGSIVLDRGNTSGLGWPGHEPLVAVYTRVATDGRQAQALAVSHDRGATWTRYPGNPVLDRGSTGFRDPKVFRYDAGAQGSWWVMVAVEAEQGRVLIYRSVDLLRWQPAGEVSSPGPEGQLSECPDLFSLPVAGRRGERQWVLVVSVNPGGPAGGSGTRYLVGEFDGAEFVPAAGSTWQWLDHGHDFYAAVSFAEVPDDRRVLLAWMSNWDYAAATPTAGWRGAMTLPREVTLEERDGRPAVVQRVAGEVGAVERQALPGLPQVVTGEHATLVVGATARIDVEWEPAGAHIVGMELAVGQDCRTVLSYDVASASLSLDRTQSGLVDFHPAFASISSASVPLRDGRLRLTIYLDACSVEVFADAGGVTITDLVFPGPDASGAVLFAHGGEARLHDLRVTPLPANR